MKKALITGIAGFAGSHLAEFLISQGIKVFGFFHPDHSISNVEHIRDSLELIPVNLLSNKDVGGAVKDINGDFVFHLAAYSSPAKSFEDPKKTLQNNIFGEINLLDAHVLIKSRARILIIGSADEYGNVDHKYLPVSELTPLNPISPYAVSKVAQDLLGYQYYLHSKLHIIRVRPFNHIGPRQSKDFVVPSFASQIASCEKRGGGTIRVGDLNSWRDFTDVRDMVHAYLLALKMCSPGEVYNIGFGKPVKIGSILKKLIAMSKVKIKVVQDKKLLQRVEVKKIYCDFSKFRRQTEWQPKIDLSKTLSDTIDYERNKL